ncbi:MAG: cytidine deaminase [Chloroflexota bacterium]
MTEQSRELIEQAKQARENAYARYSGYKVGAALLTASGEIFTGCNVENAAYGETICAERVAVTKAVSEGVNDFVAMAIVTSNAGSPCGSCRQVLNEFAPELVLYLSDGEQLQGTYKVSELLPLSFDPSHLD